MTRVHAVLTGLLIGVLAASVIVFAVMGVRQHWRRRRLARVGRQLGLEFAAADPFDIAQGFGDFALFSAGHSPRAENVSHGRSGRWRVRAFDFLYEVGHGIHRHTRYTSAVMAEIGSGLGDVTLWDGRDAVDAPLTVRQSRVMRGGRLCDGSEEAVQRLANACGDLVDLHVSAEIHREFLVLCAPVRRVDVYERLAKAIGGVCDGLCGRDDVKT